MMMMVGDDDDIIQLSMGVPLIPSTHPIISRECYQSNGYTTVERGSKDCWPMLSVKRRDNRDDDSCYNDDDDDRWWCSWSCWWWWV